VEEVRQTKSGMIWATAALAVSVAGIVAGTMFSSLEGGDRLWPVSWLAWAPVGYLILLKKPGNLVGRVLLLIGSSMGLSLFAEAVTDQASLTQIAAWAEMISVTIGVVPWFAIVYLLVIFPRPYEGLAERAVAWLIFALAFATAAAFAFSGSPMEATGLPSPLAVPELDSMTGSITGESGFLIVIAILFAALILLIFHWRRSSGIERAQFRWLFFGALVFGLILTSSQFIHEDSGALLIWLPAGFAIPVCIGIAITRYRLFEIDRIVSRTLTYAVVVGLLGAVFLGVVALVSGFLPTRDPVVVAGTTLLVAALFNPVRKRVQAVVDRRFNRSRYDTERLIERFAGELRDGGDPEEVGVGLIRVVNQAMEPKATGLWVRQ
jgi:hypothetical protein